jgi:hypothetical protein
LWKFDSGMRVSALRHFLCWMLAALCPLSLSAADTGSALLHSEGGVWINGFEISGTTAVFPGDLLETKPGFVANLDAEGSSVLIQPESIVKFEGNFLSLEHGSVSVATSTSMGVHVDCIKVEPVSIQQTQFDVTNVNNTVQVAARKNDVNITENSGLRKKSAQRGASHSATVHESQQASRDESEICGPALPPDGNGSPLNSKWLEIGVGAAVAGTIFCILYCTSSPPISPWQP